MGAEVNISTFAGLQALDEIDILEEPLGNAPDDEAYDSLDLALFRRLAQNNAVAPPKEADASEDKADVLQHLVESMPRAVKAQQREESPGILEYHSAYKAV